MDSESNIRKLAQMSQYQNLYEASKNCANIQIFENVSNFSGIQARFLYWLQIYSMLYEEFLKHEDPFLTEAVISDDVRCDAYLMRRYKKHDANWAKYRREERTAEIKRRHPHKHRSGGKMNVIDVDLRSE